MPKKPLRYIKYCYCIACQEEFLLLNKDKESCLYCQREDSFIVLSKKKETKKENDEAVKKIISIMKRMTRKNYLDGIPEESEKKELEKLKCLSAAEDFFKKNPKLKKEEMDEIIGKVNKVLED
ncbi:MAG: hypothetical protein EOM84_03550 [Sphingobacteriia bacterium]|nr:hypothetical protein [Sphingobacteriia bacterium]